MHDMTESGPRVEARAVLAGGTAPARPLAALVFDDGDLANKIVEAFAAELAADGRRLAGMIQLADETQSCQCRDSELLNVETQSRFTILQDLGRGSQSCRVDPAAIARAAVEIEGAIARAPDVLFINRFGKLEAEGGGLHGEIAAAFLAGVPTVVCVATRFLPAWRLFSEGLDQELPCSAEALRGWWTSFADERLRTPADAQA